MAATITYNGVNPFGNRTPEIDLEVVFEDNNGYIAEINRFTLKGSRPRTSCNSNFAQYKSDMDLILDYFKLQFKTFAVIENGNTIFSSQGVVRSVSFPESNFKSFYQYEIVIDCFKPYEFGVEEPNETYESSQGDSGITNITHNISCRGVGPNGVANAMAFIDNRKNSAHPEYVAETVNIKPAILTRAYSVNRLTAEVSLTTTYVYDKDDPISEYCTLTYTSDLSNNKDGTTITIQGEFQGSSIDGYNEMDRAKTRFLATDWQAIAQNEWQNFGGTSELGDHIQFSVNENSPQAQVSFTIVWNTNTEEGIYLQETWSVIKSRDGEPTCFEYQGVVKTDYGCIGQKFQAVKDYANAVNWQNRVSQLWSEYGTGESLSLIPRTKSRSESPFQGIITVEMTFCHDPTQNCGCIENLDYNLSFDEPIQQYSPQAVLKGLGLHIVQDLGFKNRRRFTILGSCRRAKCCNIEQAKATLKSRINFLSSYYFNYSDKILQEAEMETTDSGDQISFTYSWSAAV